MQPAELKPEVAADITHRLLATIDEYLARANGRRRTRILSRGDVLSVIEIAWTEGVCCLGSGNVPNNYGYPAVQTTVVAAKNIAGNRLKLATATNNAKRGSAPRPGKLGREIPQAAGPRGVAYCVAWGDSDAPADMQLNAVEVRLLLDYCND